MKKMPVITGGSRGIGAATARLAAERGYTVCIRIRNRAAAEVVTEDIRRTGGEALAVQADVSCESDVVRLFETASRSLGPLSALVNNAGIIETQARVETIDAARLARVFAVNIPALSYVHAKRCAGCRSNTAGAAAPSSTFHRWRRVSARRTNMSTTLRLKLQSRQ